MHRLRVVYYAHVTHMQITNAVRSAFSATAGLLVYICIRDFLLSA